jgi:hypothetical protein
MTDAWSKLGPEEKSALLSNAETLVRGSIIESAAARYLAMLICEAAEIARDNERGKWLDAIGEYFDGPTAESVRAYVEDRGTKMEMAELAGGAARKDTP